jgi:hypothetical protein
MGFAWRMPKGESLESYFHLYYGQKKLGSAMPLISEIMNEEKILISDIRQIEKASSICDLIKLREDEKDWNLNDLSLSIIECLDSSEIIKCPPSDELVTDSVHTLLERFYQISPKFKKKLGE